MAKRPSLNQPKLTRLSARNLIVFSFVVGVVSVNVILFSLAAIPNALKGDINGDNTVNVTDLSALLANYGKAASAANPPAADVNSDGQVNITDLSLLLSNYGKTGSVVETISINEGTTGTGTHQFEFVGAWSQWGADQLAYQNDHHWSSAVDAYYQVKFNGNQVKLYGIGDPGHGIAAVSIDGGSETDVDFYTSSRQASHVVWTSPVLATGQHTLKVRVTGRRNAAATGATISADRVDVIGTPVGPTPSPVPTPTPTPPASGAFPKPIWQFASNNIWYTPLPNSVPLLDSSSQQARNNELRLWMNPPAAWGAGQRVEQSQYSASVYVVDNARNVYRPDGTLVQSNVGLMRMGAQSPGTGAYFLNQIWRGTDPNNGGTPVASWMKGSPGERHVAIYNKDNRRYWEQMDYEPTAGTGGWGGFYFDLGTYAHSAMNRRTYDINDLRYQQSNWSATALRGPIIGTLILDHEINRAYENWKKGDYANAYIPHVLAYEGMRHTQNTWEYPAAGTDWAEYYGQAGNGNIGGRGSGPIPMGGLFRVRPDFDVTTLRAPEDAGLSLEQVRQKVANNTGGRGTAHAQIIARSWQKHGSTMTDWSTSFCLLSETVWNTNGTPGPMHNWGGGAPWHYGAEWLKPLVLNLLDQNLIQWVNTGRNMESDTGGIAQPGTYRPGQ